MVKIWTEKIKLISLILFVLNIIISSLTYNYFSSGILAVTVFFIITLLILINHVFIVIYKTWISFQLEKSTDQLSELKNSIQRIESFQRKQENSLSMIEDNYKKFTRSIYNFNLTIDETHQKIEGLVRNIKSLDNDLLENRKILKEKYDGIETQLVTLHSNIDHIKNSIESLNYSEDLNSIRSSTEGILSNLNELSLVLKNSEIEQLKSKIELFRTKVEELSSNTKENVNFISRRITQESNINYNRIDALLSILNTIETSHSLPIMRSWTISSEYGLDLINTYIDHDGTSIDIGSGISSLLLGYVKKEKGGKRRVISIEHSEEYFEASKVELEKHGLIDHVEIYYCPLIDYTLEGKTWKWYDISKIDNISNVSLISVDGPPGSTQDLTRYPALPILKDFITENTIVFLDDAYRKEEKEIAEQWEKELELSKTLIDSQHGHYKLQKK